MLYNIHLTINFSSLTELKFSNTNEKINKISLSNRSDSEDHYGLYLGGNKVYKKTINLV
jgi:hypothetical protein